MNVSLQKMVPPSVIRGFDISRRKLIETLSNLTFMKVTVVTFPQDAHRTGTHFQGEATELFPGRNSQLPKSAFFSRFSRQVGNGFMFLGAFSLIDCPVGPQHASSVPQVGDILVGSLIPSKKGKLPFELRGWSNNAKPLLEMARILQYGTRMSSKELKMHLKQPASSTANAMLKLKTALTFEESRHATFASTAADDFYFIVKTVCMGDMSEDAELKLSKTHVEFMDHLAMRLQDDAFLESWASKRPVSYDPQSVVYAPAIYAPTVYDPAVYQPIVSWKPTTPLYDPNAYSPTSPPESPKYIPTSPPGSPPKN